MTVVSGHTFPMVASFGVYEFNSPEGRFPEVNHEALASFRCSDWNKGAFEVYDFPPALAQARAVVVRE